MAWLFVLDVSKRENSSFNYDQAAVGKVLSLRPYVGNSFLTRSFSPYHHSNFMSNYHMMTSSNENILRVTGHVCWEFTGHRWISRKKAGDAELWCFLWSAPAKNGWVSNCETGDLRRHIGHYDVTVMIDKSDEHTKWQRQKSEVKVTEGKQILPQFRHFWIVTWVWLHR